MVMSSGSKSQFGSGVPAAALAKRSSSVVVAPSAMLWQKPVPPSPRAALNVVGSHSSNATTCAMPGESLAGDDESHPNPDATIATTPTQMLLRNMDLLLAGAAGAGQ